MATPPADGPGGDRGPVAKFVSENLFLTGLGCGILLSSLTLRNGAGLTTGVMAGLWYQQEAGAPDLRAAFNSVHATVSEALDSTQSKDK